MWNNYCYKNCSSIKMWALSFTCLALIHCHLCTSLSFIENLRAHFTVLLSIPSLSLFWVIWRLLGYLLIRSSSLVTSLSCLCSTGSRDYTPASLHSLPTSAVLPDFSDMTPFHPSQFTPDYFLPQLSLRFHWQSLADTSLSPSYFTVNFSSSPWENSVLNVCFLFPLNSTKLRSHIWTSLNTFSSLYSTLSASQWSCFSFLVLVSVLTAAV